MGGAEPRPCWDREHSRPKDAAYLHERRSKAEVPLLPVQAKTILHFVQRLSLEPTLAEVQQRDPWFE